jgi:hypothetical protein
MEQIDTTTGGAADSFKYDEEVLSSDEEQERQEELKEKFTAAVTLNNVSGEVKNVLVCAAGNA